MLTPESELRELLRPVTEIEVAEIIELLTKAGGYHNALVVRRMMYEIDAAREAIKKRGDLRCRR